MRRKKAGSKNKVECKLRVVLCGIPFCFELGKTTQCFMHLYIYFKFFKHLIIMDLNRICLCILMSKKNQSSGFLKIVLFSAAETALLFVT